MIFNRKYNVAFRFLIKEFNYGVFPADWGNGVEFSCWSVKFIDERKLKMIEDELKKNILFRWIFQFFIKKISFTFGNFSTRDANLTF